MRAFRRNDGGAIATQGSSSGFARAPPGCFRCSLSPSSEECVHEAIARLALASPAALAVLPMQDLLGLGAAARMNLPGTATGNWRWRLAPRAASATLARRLRAMVEATGRL